MLIWHIFYYFFWLSSEIFSLFWQHLYLPRERVKVEAIGVCLYKPNQKWTPLQVLPLRDTLLIFSNSGFSSDSFPWTNVIHHEIFSLRAENPPRYLPIINLKDNPKDYWFSTLWVSFLRDIETNYSIFGPFWRRGFDCHKRYWVDLRVVVLRSWDLSIGWYCNCQID